MSPLKSAECARKLPPRCRRRVASKPSLAERWAKGKKCVALTSCVLLSAAHLNCVNKTSLRDYLLLHLVVLAWGFTAILGKLIVLAPVAS